MTTELPEGIATPDRLETPIGVLNLVDGIPDEETTRKIYDNLDLQRRGAGLHELAANCFS